MTVSTNNLINGIKKIGGYWAHSDFKGKLGKCGSLIGMVSVAIVFSAISPFFLTLDNWIDILRQSAPAIIAACGLTFVIAGGGFDLSVGAQASLSCVMSVYLMLQGWPIWTAVVAALLCGALLGSFNGFVCGTLGIVPWVGTLLIMLFASGPQYIATGGGRVQYLASDAFSAFTFLGKGAICGIPTPVVISLSIGILAHLFLSKTKIGYNIQAIGSSKQAASLAGIPRKKYMWLIYIICGLFASAAGIMVAARLGGSQVRTADPMMTEAIAAVYIGSTIFRDGEPYIIGSIIGAIFIGMMRTGITLVGVPYWGEYLFRGIIVFAAIILSGIRSK